MSNLISAEELNNYSAMKNFFFDDLGYFVKNQIGLHSSRASTPYLVLFSRSDVCNASHLNHLLYSEEKLVKLRCMRGTLHVVHDHYFKPLHFSTLSRRLQICNRINGRTGLTSNQLMSLKDKIKCNFKLDDKINSEVVMQKLYGTNVSSSLVLGVRACLREMWEIGELKYFDASEKILKEKRLYKLVAPPVRDEDDYKYKKIIIDQYVETFGPVLFEDIKWWTNFDSKSIHSILSSSGYFEICVKGFSGTFYSKISTLEIMEKLRVTKRPPFSGFLSFEDNYLKSCFLSRSKYYDLKFNKKLFVNGESKPAIVNNNKVVGTWRFNMMTSEIECDYFEPRENAIHFEMSRKKSLMENYLLTGET